MVAIRLTFCILFTSLYTSLFGQDARSEERLTGVPDELPFFSCENVELKRFLRDTILELYPSLVDTSIAIVFSFNLDTVGVSSDFEFYKPLENSIKESIVKVMLNNKFCKPAIHRHRPIEFRMSVMFNLNE